MLLIYLDKSAKSYYLWPLNAEPIDRSRQCFPIHWPVWTHHAQYDTVHLGSQDLHLIPGVVGTVRCLYEFEQLRNVTSIVRARPLKI